MEAKESLVNIIKALTEVGQPLTKQILTDFLTGKETRETVAMQAEDYETFGCGDMHDEDYWSTVIDAALESKFLKMKPAKSDTIGPTTEGKKFAKKPTSFEIPDEDEPNDSLTDDRGLDALVLMAQSDKMATESVTSARTKQQIKLIQAVDRKIALDDFAENEGLGLDEVLDELEALVHQGRKMDITYFTDEVLGQECVDELIDFFGTVKKDHVLAAANEFDDVYNEEEIRLAYIIYLVRKAK